MIWRGRMTPNGEGEKGEEPHGEPDMGFSEAAMALTVDCIVWSESRESEGEHGEFIEKLEHLATSCGRGQAQVSVPAACTSVHLYVCSLVSGWFPGWSHEIGWFKWFLVAPLFPRQTNPDSRLLPVGCCLQQFRDAPPVVRCVAGRAEDTIHASRAWNHYLPGAGQPANW